MNRQVCWPLVLLLTLTMGGGCQPFGSVVPKQPPPEGQVRIERPEERVAPPPPEPDFQPGHLRPEELAAEIAALETTAKAAQASDSARAEAFRRLALLHLSPRNPSRNPTLAAEAQSSYLKLQPDGPARQEGEIWLALILDDLERERMQQQQAEKIREKEVALTELGAEKQRQAQKLAALETANAKLKEDIEKLKFIDLSMEKKRKSFR